MPPYDLVFNTIEEADVSAAAIERCSRFAASQHKPVVNHPSHLPKVRRSALRTTLRDVAGCIVPRTVRRSRDALAAAVDAPGDVVETGFPLLARPVDSHGGIAFERLADSDQLAEYLSRVTSDDFYVSPFVDYRSADGYYRKYRVVVVDGEPFPYHLAISDAWKVHYYSSLMEQHAWMRAEEERFLADPPSVFAAWETVFRDIARAVGLDYFGVDCALQADGSVLIFECGGGMLVHCMDSPDLFGYKYRYVPRIFAALDGLFARLAATSR